MNWVDEIIAEGEAIIADFNVEKAAYYISRSLSLLSDCGVDKPKVGMQTQKQRMAVIGANSSWSTPGPSDSEYLEDVKTLVLRFKRIKAQIESGEKGAGGTVVNIDNRNENVNTASARMDLAATFEAIQSLPASTLSDADKNALSGMLAILQSLEGDQKKSKLMEIIKWLGDKAVDVSIAVIPMIAGML